MHFCAARGSAFVSLLFRIGIVLAAGLSSFGLWADTLSPALMAKVRAATFEVVMAKPAHDPLTYEKPLPMDLIPYQQRNDKFFSVGSAFALGHNRYVTAGHVITLALHSLWGPPALRDAKGQVYAIDKIEKYASDRDFVVFSLTSDPAVAPLDVDRRPVLNQPVFAVGNALGEGVVARDGTYTSQTPEAQNGAWRWLRFSAAASPGDSGGPLLDQDGKVIGVVLAKSPNENLNYALPISELLDAPDHVAVLDRRDAYRMPVMDEQSTQPYRKTFALPMSLADFTAKLGQLDEERTQALRSALLKQQADRLFPLGAGSSHILHAFAPLNTMPQLLVRSADGQWRGVMQKGPHFSLQDGARVTMGRVDPTLYFFHVRRPDHLAANQFYDNPQRLMDTLLSAGLSNRTIGSASIKVVSDGEPTETVRHIDAWGRPWRVDVWPIPFGNMYEIAMSLPVPDGYVVAFRVVQAANEPAYVDDMQALADFVSVAYGGSLQQWHEFLQDKALLPAALADVRLDVDYGRSFRYDSNHIKVAFTQKVQKIAPDSTLTLGFGFFNHHGQYGLDVADVRVTPQDGLADRINIRRVLQPTDDMGAEAKARWQKYMLGQHPFDGVAYVENDKAGIGKVLKPAHAQPGVLYSAFLAVEGSQPPELMKSKMDALMDGVQIDD
ncbi:MAG TPA: serine protease [Dyella sp.]|nr:serine protease [Dyella sp.]